MQRRSQWRRGHLRPLARTPEQKQAKRVDLLRELYRARQLLEGWPGRDEMQRLYREGRVKYSHSMYKGGRGYFDGWEDALRECQTLIDKGFFESETTPMLTPTDAGRMQANEPALEVSRVEGWRYIRKPGVLIRPPPPPTRTISVESGGELRYRSMDHEPTNEQGVRLLFGLVAEDLGWKIVAGREDFPDCLIRMQNDRGRWEQRRVELEFKSSGLKHHADEMGACDLVVCWEDDWGEECPIDRLDLRQVVYDLLKRQ